MNRVRTANRSGRRLRHPEVADLARAHQFRHRADRFFDWHLLVDAMLVIKIDVVDAEALQRRIAGGSNVLGLSVDRSLAVGQHLVAEFGRDDDAIAMLFQDRADQRLVVADTIDIGGVEEVDPEFYGPLQRRGGLSVVARPVELRHPHASEPQLRHFETLAAKLAFFHQSSTSLRTLLTIE